jgi:hypothetical protein
VIGRSPDESGRTAATSGNCRPEGHAGQVTILAVQTHAGWHRLQPTVQYTALLEEGQKV